MIRFLRAKGLTTMRLWEPFFFPKCGYNTDRGWLFHNRQADGLYRLWAPDSGDFQRGPGRWSPNLPADPFTSGAAGQDFYMEQMRRQMKRTRRGNPMDVGGMLEELLV